MLKKTDLYQLSYHEFGELLNILTDKLSGYQDSNNLKFDCTVPILRSGGPTATHVASSLGIEDMIPSQYKYYYNPTRIVQKFSMPEPNTSTTFQHILIVDSNTMEGKTAEKVIQECQQLFPSSKLYFASLVMDCSYVRHSAVTEIFYAKLGNDLRTIPELTAKDKGIDNRSIIFPREDMEKEWIALSQF